MLASGSGPLGALLMIAPLAAIPVFAVVGIPQISPMVASATDEEEILPDRDSRTESTRPAPRRSRSADDLFAPVSSPAPDPFDVPPSRRKPEARGDRTESDSRLRTHSRERAAAPDLDEGWEVVPDPDDSGMIPRGRSAVEPDTLPDSFDGPRARPTREGNRRPRNARSEMARAETTPDDGVLADQFDPGLLQSGATAPAAPRRTPSEPPPASRERRAGRDLIPTAPGQPGGESDRGEAPVQEQPRWQMAATRLKDLGIERYKLAWNFERQKFLFRCVLPATDGSDVSDLFEADADTPLEAVEAVVEQIEDWLRTGRNSGGSID